MKKAKFAGLMFFIFNILCPFSANAQLWQGAKNLAQGESSIGIHFQFHGMPTRSTYKLMSFGQFTYGYTDQLEFQGFLGLGSLGYDTGGFAKLQLYSEDLLSLAILTGLQLAGRLLLDTNFIVSFTWKPIEVYSGVYFSIPFGGEAFAVGLIPGINYEITKTFRLYFETTLDLADYYTAMSFGFRSFF